MKEQYAWKTKYAGLGWRIEKPVTSDYLFIR